jgi:hypothetical protein
VNSKEENFCQAFVQEFGLRIVSKKTLRTELLYAQNEFTLVSSPIALLQSFSPLNFIVML